MKSANALTALAGGLGCHAASVNNSQIGGFRANRRQAAGSQQLGDLLAFVMIDLAPERLNKERFHDFDRSAE